MRHIMVLNAKGGCGKSTLATNIASYFVTEGANVALADYDPQRSSLDWLERRPDNPNWHPAHETPTLSTPRRPQNTTGDEAS